MASYPFHSIPSSYTFEIFSTSWRLIILTDIILTSISAAHPIKAMLKGIQKSQGQARLTCMPIFSQIFHGLADLLSLSPFGLGPSLVLKAAVFLSFFGFLRHPGRCPRLATMHLYSSKVVSPGYLIIFHFNSPTTKTVRQVRVS